MLNGKSEKRVFTKKKLMTTKKIGRLNTARYLLIFISSLQSDVMDLTISIDSADLPVDEQSINFSRKRNLDVLTACPFTLYIFPMGDGA